MRGANTGGSHGRAGSRADRGASCAGRGAHPGAPTRDGRSRSAADTRAITDARNGHTHNEGGGLLYRRQGSSAR
jgi:hypothetical protein